MLKSMKSMLFKYAKLHFVLATTSMASIMSDSMETK